MKKNVFLLALVLFGLFMLRQKVFSGYCTGVTKCTEWGPSGSCSSIQTAAKVCSGNTEEACYANQLDCVDKCTTSSCTWVTEAGDPTPTAGGGASCNTTPPSHLKITRGSPNDTITWSPGYGGSSQLLLVSDDSLAVRFNCNSNGYTKDDCIVFKSLANGIGTYSVPAATFDDYSIYYVKVVELAGVCSGSTTRPWISTCTLNPASWTFTARNQTKVFTVPIADTLNAFSGLKQVNFTSNDTAVATVNPDIDSNTATQNETFRTTATAKSLALPATDVVAHIVLRSDEYGDFIDCGASSPVGPIKLQCLSSRFLRVVKSHCSLKTDH